MPPTGMGCNFRRCLSIKRLEIVLPEPAAGERLPQRQPGALALPLCHLDDQQRAAPTGPLVRLIRLCGLPHEPLRRRVGVGRAPPCLAYPQWSKNFSAIVAIKGIIHRAAVFRSQ